MQHAPRECAGLVVSAHGSRSPEWNTAVAELAARVAAMPAVSAAFGAGVRCGFLGGAGPALAAQTAALLSAGASHVVVVPLFLTASGHVEEDLPIILGAQDDPVGRARLSRTGIECLPPGTPVRLVSSDKLALIAGSAVRRARSLSESPADEGVLLLVYGSSRYGRQWDRLVEHACVAVLKDGFAGCASAAIGPVVGLSPQPARQALAGLLATNRRALVIPLLVARGQLQSRNIPAAIAALPPADQERVRYAADAILPDPAIEAWVAEAALSALVS